MAEGAQSGRAPRRSPAGWTSRSQQRVDLGLTITRLRRALRRAILRRMGIEGLPEAQVELLVLVHDTPGIRVNDAAARLGVAANTVSTQVGRLVTAGLVERTVDPDDARGGCLQLTDTAQAQVKAWRGHRGAIIDESLAKLDVADGTAIENALPALWRLSALLEELATADPPPTA